jgi:hypothetical protein
VVVLLIEILLPVTAGEEARQVVEDVTQTLTNKFGGATAFLRAPGDGAWKGQTGIITDQIIVVEVMAEAVEPEWWRIFRTELEIRLDQEEIVIRSHEIKRL